MLPPISLFALIAVWPAFHLPQDSKAAIVERIIGGKEVRLNSYPFVVRLESFFNTGGVGQCGGTLISENYVVTAAHCVYNSKLPLRNLRLHFGDHYLSKKEDNETSMDIPLLNIKRHPEYDSGNNDIALIKLPHKVQTSAVVRPLCVASADLVVKASSGTAMGWGLTKNAQKGGKGSEVLKEVILPIMPHSGCKRFGPGFNPQIMICAGNIEGKEEAICAGDSGGPLVVNGTQLALAGISSFVSGNGCVTVGVGVVFTRVATFISWLKADMGADLCIVQK